VTANRHAVEPNVFARVALQRHFWCSRGHRWCALSAAPSLVRFGRVIAMFLLLSRFLTRNS
jgi:hypothetical protein